MLARFFVPYVASRARTADGALPDWTLFLIHGPTALGKMRERLDRLSEKGTEGPTRAGEMASTALVTAIF